MSSGLTPTQRRLLIRLLTAELVRARMAALAAGAREADVNAATVRRCRAIRAMIATDTGSSDPTA